MEIASVDGTMDGGPIDFRKIQERYLAANVTPFKKFLSRRKKKKTDEIFQEIFNPLHR